ncbi:MAG: type IX secretion system protein PorQ [Bacteroidetes bacterium]|nr:MAG: type IX secretion system protein PorQ [Bacteroidota bacterium]
MRQGAPDTGIYRMTMRLTYLCPSRLITALKARSPALLIFIMMTLPARSQTGGDNTYEFLNLSHSAFVNATGGITVSSSRSDLSLPYYNPSLLNATMHNDISLSFSTWVAGITYGYASWAHHTETAGTFAGGISFISYGNFTEADAAGNITGSFSAGEYALNIIWSWKIDSSFTIGANLKPVISHLESYFSAGLCIDIGASYHNEDLLLDAGLVIRNAGFQLRSYTGNGGEPLPFEIIAGASKRLAHAPFRFTLTARHLEKPDMTYDYDTEDDTGPGGFGEDILRHLALGAEILPSESFWIGAGLNYQRRAEMRTGQRTGMAGFTAGFGIRTKAFDLAYAHDAFHPAGGSNHFTVTLRPELIFKK